MRDCIPELVTCETRHIGVLQYFGFLPGVISNKQIQGAAFTVPERYALSEQYGISEQQG